VSLAQFEIEITRQCWIRDTPESEGHDLCSHGNLRLIIGGAVILPGDDEREYTISTSALALLRTIESDHVPPSPDGVELILHCGMLLMLSCPIGVDWTVRHGDGRVRLSDVVRVDTIGDETPFPDLDAELSEDDYRVHIVAFAQGARDFFDGVEKEIDPDDIDAKLYPAFWEEYERLLARHSRAPKS
jgi:hypothetical protein